MIFTGISCFLLTLNQNQNEKVFSVFMHSADIDFFAMQ